MSDYTLSTTVRQPYDATVVEAFDPAAMLAMGDGAADSPVATVAADARERPTALLDTLAKD